MAHRHRELWLALQGGGAHGAFTWGVLDALLDDARFTLRAASGASAGACNAVVLAQGLMAGGRDGARQALEAFWSVVAASLPAGSADDSGKASAWLRSWWWWSRLLSPRELNPLGFDPLRRIVAGLVDFAALRRHSPLRLYIAATHAESGALRIFREHELSADALLASCCLPQMRHAVVIDGQAYWDGGYAANPPLLPLLLDPACADLLIVPLMPCRRSPLPASAHEIESRSVELAFTTPFLAELRTLAAWRRELPRWWPARWQRPPRLARLHLVEGAAVLDALAPESRLVPSQAFLRLLRDHGRRRAYQWLEGDGGHVGRRSTFDPARFTG